MEDKSALVIVNFEYPEESLEFPEIDGNIMETILCDAGWKVKIIKNCENISEVVDEMVKKFQDKPLSRFHFHYSGKKSSLW